MQSNSAARLDRMTCSLHACATPHWCEWTALNSLSICMCEHAGRVSQTNAMYLFCSDQWQVFFFFQFSSRGRPSHSAATKSYVLIRSSPRNRRLILDSCMPFKTFLAIISFFNAMLFHSFAHLQNEQLYTWAPVGQNEIRTPGRLQTMWPPTPTSVQVWECLPIWICMPILRIVQLLFPLCDKHTIICMITIFKC